MCFDVKFSNNNQQCDRFLRVFVLRLLLNTDSNAGYSVNIRQENATITVTIDDCKLVKETI